MSDAKSSLMTMTDAKVKVVNREEKGRKKEYLLYEDERDFTTFVDKEQLEIAAYKFRLLISAHKYKYKNPFSCSYLYLPHSIEIQVGCLFFLSFFFLPLSLTLRCLSLGFDFVLSLTLHCPYGLGSPLSHQALILTYFGEYCQCMYPYLI